MVDDWTYHFEYTSNTHRIRCNPYHSRNNSILHLRRSNLVHLKYDVFAGVSLFWKDMTILQLNKKNYHQRKTVYYNPICCTFRSNSNRTFVFYIRIANAMDYGTWLNVATCFKLWNIRPRGFHKLMVRLWIKGNRVVVVGSTSPYAVHKPPGVTPLLITKYKFQPDRMERNG